MTLLEIVIELREARVDYLTAQSSGREAEAREAEQRVNNALAILTAYGPGRETLNHVCYHCGGNGHTPHPR